MERLFAEDFSSADLSEYVYETTPESEISLHSEEDGICEECEKNAKNFTEADYEASLAAEPGEEATASDEVSAYAMSDLSKEQQNIVNRAEEQAKVTWTPLKNVSGSGWGLYVPGRKDLYRNSLRTACLCKICSV